MLLLPICTTWSVKFSAAYCSYFAFYDNMGYCKAPVGFMHLTYRDPILLLACGSFNQVVYINKGFLEGCWEMDLLCVQQTPALLNINKSDKTISISIRNLSWKQNPLYHSDYIISLWLWITMNEWYQVFGKTWTLFTSMKHVCFNAALFKPFRWMNGE